MRWAAINYPAILAAAIAGMLVGLAWYSRALFGPAWAQCRGIDVRDSKQSLELHKGMGGVYTATFAATLLSAFAPCVLVVRVRAGGALGGLELGFLEWLRFTMTVQLTAALFSHKNRTLFFIDTGFQLVCYLAMGAILGGWQLP